MSMRDMNEGLTEYEENVELDNSEIEESLEQEYEKTYGQTYSTEEWENIVKLYNSDDPAARNEAGEKAYFALKPFILSIAKKLYGSYLNKYAEDLMSEGALGLCESLKTYNPKKGKPTTWCYRSIVHYMREFIDREVHHTTPHYQRNIKKIRDFITEKEAAGEPWSYDDIVVHTGISLTTILNCLTIDKRNRNSVSIESEIGDGNAMLKDYLQSDTPNPEEYVIKHDNIHQLYQDLKECLDEKERMVVVLHYGFGDDEPKSAVEIEKLTGIRKQFVRPLLNMAEYKLRRYAKYKERYEPERRERILYTHGPLISLLKSKETLAEELDAMMFEDLEDEIDFLGDQSSSQESINQ